MDNNDDELTQLRQAALKSMKDKKTDNYASNVSTSKSPNQRAVTQAHSLQTSNGPKRSASQHNSPLLPSPPLTVQQSKACKSNIVPYNGDFNSTKSQPLVNNGQRFISTSPSSPIRGHHSSQSSQQSSAVHSQQPHHSQQQASSQSSQSSSSRHHHVPPVHNQGFTGASNPFYRPNGGPPPPPAPQLGHHGINSMSPHMTGLPVPYGHQGAPPPPPPLPGHPAYRPPPYPQAPHHPPPPPSAPPGLPHLPPGPPFRPMHAPSSFHPPAGYTPMHFAKRPSGPRHGFHNFYPASFNHNVNSGPNHMHTSNDHSPPHLQPPHLLAHGPNGLHAPSVKMPLNDSVHRSHFNDTRNAPNHTGHRRKPYDTPASNRGSSHNYNNNSDDQSQRNGSSSSSQSRSQHDSRNSPSCRDANDRMSSRFNENDSDSPKHKGPERFSRLERSDSESDEDDRLDGFLGDLNDDADGDSADKSQDSLYDSSCNQNTNALLEEEDNADDDGDQDEGDDKAVDENDELCKFEKSHDHERPKDEKNEHQVKRAKLM